MALARILGCAFQKNHLFMRNASFYRDVYSTSKYAWFYTKTCANIRIEPNKWYEKVTSQKSEETEETKKVDAAKKHDRGEFHVLYFVTFCCKTVMIYLFFLFR